MLVGLRKSDFSPKLISEEANAAMEEREGERELLAFLFPASCFSLSGFLNRLSSREQVRIPI